MSEKTLTITLELTEKELEELHTALQEWDCARVWTNRDETVRAVINQLVASQAVAGEWKEARAGATWTRPEDATPEPYERLLVKPEPDTGSQPHKVWWANGRFEIETEDAWSSYTNELEGVEHWMYHPNG